MSDSRSSSTEGRQPERDRWPPLTRMLMSGEMSGEAPRDLTWREKLGRWLAQQGSQNLFVFMFVIVHSMIFAFGFTNYHLKDNLNEARATFGVTYAIARAAALVLHFDIAILIFPVCRTLISLARQTALNGIIQFDESISFHKLVAWSLVFFSWLHTFAHWNNFARLSAQHAIGFRGFLRINFTTGPGWTGFIMLTCLMLIFAMSLERVRRANFERFWYTHHLFIVFFVFWSIHGAFCMIKPDNGSGSACKGTGVFWQYWMYGGFVYLVERILREVRGRHKTYITKVIQHPSKVVEIQMKKENTKSRAGQVIHNQVNYLVFVADWIAVCLSLLSWNIRLAISPLHLNQRPWGGLHFSPYSMRGGLHDSSSSRSWLSFRQREQRSTRPRNFSCGRPRPEGFDPRPRPVSQENPTSGIYRRTIWKRIRRRVQVRNCRPRRSRNWRYPICFDLEEHLVPHELPFKTDAPSKSILLLGLPRLWILWMVQIFTHGYWIPGYGQPYWNPHRMSFPHNYPVPPSNSIKNINLPSPFSLCST